MKKRGVQCFFPCIFALGAFFLFIHYSHATHLDHGEDVYSPFPVRCPRDGGSLQAPLLPSAQACPETVWCAPRKLQRKRTKEKGERVGQREGRRGEHCLRHSCGRHQFGCGQDRGGSPPAPSSSAPRSLLLQLIPHLQLRHRAHSVILYLSRHPPSDIRRGEEVQYRLAAPPIGQEVPHLPPVLPSPRLLLHLRPQGLLLWPPLWACLKRWSRVCVRYRHHQHCGVDRFFVQLRYCPVRQCPVLIW